MTRSPRTSKKLKPRSTFKPPLNKDVIEAAKSLVMMDLGLLQAEAAAGSIKSPIEQLAKQIL